MAWPVHSTCAMTLMLLVGARESRGFVRFGRRRPIWVRAENGAVEGLGAGCVVEGGAWLLGAHSASIEGGEGGATHVLHVLCAKSLTTGEERTGRQKGLRPRHRCCSDTVSIVHYLKMYVQGDGCVSDGCFQILACGELLDASVCSRIDEKCKALPGDSGTADLLI